MREFRVELTNIQTFWAMPFMTPDHNTNATTPSGFTMSFTAVALLTYVLSTCIVLWVWGISFRNIKVYIGITFRDFASSAIEKLMSTTNYIQGLKRKSSAESDQEAQY